jgi:hypothetical protein
MVRTGRVVHAKVEADGDIHIALTDATGNKVGTVSAEIPVGPKWSEIRQIVFGWTTQEFPFIVKTAHTLKISEHHVITVTGKAFLRFCPRSRRSFKPQKDAERLRGMGGPSGNANGSDSMKRYWEIIDDNLSKAGWSWGCVSAVDVPTRLLNESAQ